MLKKRSAPLLAWLRRVCARRRLTLALLAGAAVGILSPGAWQPATRLALAWNLGVVVFLALTAFVVGSGSSSRARERARVQDARAWVILALVVVAAGVSMIALGFLLRREEGATTLTHVLRFGLVGLTVSSSWLLTHVMFAIHYTHHYYDGIEDGEGSPDRGGLEFPGGKDPDYWDFLYFATVIGMTSQTSDVQITTKAMRRIVTVHGIVSFAFNVVVLALTVNLLASSF